MSETPGKNEVRKHRLVIYEIMSKRLRNKFLLLFLILLGIGIYDIENPILAENLWFYYWIVILLVFILWIYYALLLPRASIQMRPKSLRLQGPFIAFNISYARVHSVTSAQMSQHFPFDSLKGREQVVLEPLYNRTCVFIELSSYPGTFRWRHLWLPKYLFGTSRPGIVCVTKDWLSLSRDVEAYRSERYERVNNADKAKTRTLVGRILAEE